MRISDWSSDVCSSDLVWKKVPPLGRWIFPDLNGEWDVEIVSNHSIHGQLGDAAARRTEKLDIDLCPHCDLVPLMTDHPKADIVQTCVKSAVVLANPAGNPSSRRSKVLTVLSLPAEDLKTGSNS